MSKLRWYTFTVGTCAAAALSAACSGMGPSRSGIAPLSMHNRLDAFVGVGPHGTFQTNHRKSWVSADAKDEPELLFASDSGLGEVDMYALPSMKLEGQLTGFAVPQGLCSDTHGNVYVAETNATEVDELSHSGSRLARYADNYGLPVGCAVDPASGELAVTDLVNDGSGPGEVLVFSNPSSGPKVLTNPDAYYYYFAGYGPGGRLWVSGTDASGHYMLSQCGSFNCRTVKLEHGALYYPGAVQWDNGRGTWVVFDQLCNNTPSACSYPVSARGELGKPTTYTNYQGGSDCDLIQGEIVGRDRHVVGGDYEYCGAAASTFDSWAYTSGGKPTKHAALAGPGSVPNGVAVSTKS